MSNQHMNKYNPPRTQSAPPQQYHAPPYAHFPSVPVVHPYVPYGYPPNPNPNYFMHQGYPVNKGGFTNNPTVPQGAMKGQFGGGVGGGAPYNIPQPTPKKPINITTTDGTPWQPTQAQKTEASSVTSPKKIAVTNAVKAKIDFKFETKKEEEQRTPEGQQSNSESLNQQQQPENKEIIEQKVEQKQEIKEDIKVVEEKKEQLVAAEQHIEEVKQNEKVNEVKESVKEEDNKETKEVSTTESKHTEKTQKEEDWESLTDQELVNLPNATLGHWTPDNEDGLKEYPIEFLLKFRDLCKKRPKEMVNFDITVEKDWKKNGHPYSRTNMRPSSPKPKPQGGRGRGLNSAPKPNPVVLKRENLSKVELVIKAATGLLNKLTFEKFDSLSKKIVDVGIDEDTLEPVIKLVFEKAVTEPTYSKMYTKLCKILSEKYPTYQRDGETISFRRLLLNKCQGEFENKKTIDDPDKLSREELDELDRKIRVRMKGNIIFIGELFKEKMLNDTIIHYCIKHLLGDPKNPDPSNIEGLCKFFTSIGKILDTPKNREKMETYFGSLNHIKLYSNLLPRIKYGIEDVLDLRKDNWVPRRPVIDAPDTLAAVQSKQAQAQITNRKDSNTNLSSPKRGGQHNKSEYRKVENSGSSRNSNNNLHNNNNNNNSSNKQPMKLSPHSGLMPSNAPSRSNSNDNNNSNNNSNSTPVTQQSLVSMIDEAIQQDSCEVSDFKDFVELFDIAYEIIHYMARKVLKPAPVAKLIILMIDQSLFTLNNFIEGFAKLLMLNYDDLSEDFPKLYQHLWEVFLTLGKKYGFDSLLSLEDDKHQVSSFLLQKTKADFVEILAPYLKKLIEEDCQKAAKFYCALDSEIRDKELLKTLLLQFVNGKVDEFVQELQSINVAVSQSVKNATAGNQSN